MNWITALGHLTSEAQSHVLLTVLDTRGSSPRDAGTKMVVSESHVYDTIGGGALEYQCIEVAREFLLGHPQASQHTQKFNLGKDLKQCCGGVVSVLFEVFPACDFTINIFGAGHIGQALTKLLCDIECKVQLFDSRSDLLKQKYPKHITTHDLSRPEVEVEACASNSYYLVMTHDHALDQQLCESIIARGDSAYCGVIGSRTKAVKFRHRLQKKGFSPNELQQLTCPMGLQELKTKKPQEIAISILAELLMLRDKNKARNTNSATSDEKVVHLENND